MEQYPVSRGCPKCRGRAYVRRGTARVCRECLTRYVAPDVGDRVLFGIAFIIPGLLFSTLAVFLVMAMMTPGNSDSPLCLACPGSIGLLGVVAVGWGFKEMAGRRKRRAPRPGAAADSPAPALSRAMAKEMVEWVENVYHTGDSGDQLGTLRFGSLDEQVAWFAPEWEDGERPLFFVDTSRGRDGTAGILVSDRRLYASALDEPIALADISDVTCEEPTGYHGLFILLAILLLVLCLFVGWIVLVFRLAWLGGAATQKMSRRRFLVNGQEVYATRREINTALWVDVFLSLGKAARDAAVALPEEAKPAAAAPPSDGITRHVGLTTASPPASRSGPPARPATTVLETLPHSPDGAPLDREVVDDPPWERVERSIRAMDGHAHPLVRLWAGRPFQARGLEIVGGRGKYALREVCDGWVYYDPNGADEDVEVQTSGGGHRVAGYYVCTDVERVLRIARQFCATGVAGDVDAE